MKRVSKKRLLEKMNEIAQEHNVILTLSNERYYLDRYKEWGYNPKYCILISHKLQKNCFKMFCYGTTLKELYDKLCITKKYEDILFYSETI